jgi:hypothetical protein
MVGIREPIVPEVVTHSSRYHTYQVEVSQFG